VLKIHNDSDHNLTTRHRHVLEPLWHRNDIAACADEREAVRLRLLRDLSMSGVMAAAALAAYGPARPASTKRASA
jgi:hypothetical protein